MMSKIIPVITVDGPSGSGKGTISQLLAKQLGWHFLDSGALYRVLALAAKQHAVEFDNEAALEVLAGHLDVQFVTNITGMMPQVILEGTDVSEVIRGEECGNAASKVGALPKVRIQLLGRQRAFRELPGLVADGRDMGTVVFPDAQLKIFLQATPKERVMRRLNQLKEKGLNVTFEAIHKELLERDLRDKERAVSPLKPAADAVIIDTTGLSIDQVLTQIMQLASRVL